MKRIEFIRLAPTALLGVFIASDIGDDSKLHIIQHVRHGLLDFDLHPTYVNTLPDLEPFRIDHLFSNGISTQADKDLFIYTTEKQQKIFSGKQKLNEFLKTIRPDLDV